VGALGTAADTARDGLISTTELVARVNRRVRALTRDEQPPGDPLSRHAFRRALTIGT
jgi:hypothetical protein